MPSDRIFVTGVGCVCAAGSDSAGFFQASLRGDVNASAPANIRLGLESPPPVFEVGRTDAGLESELSGPGSTRTVRLLSLAVLEALSMAGLDPSRLGRLRVGVCVGTTVGCALNNEAAYRDFKGGSASSVEAVGRYLSNNPALFVSSRLGLKGPSATVANACSSGTDAIGIAAMWLRRGLCDIAVAGGADELSRTTCLGFHSLMVTSSEPCRPFDRRRSGLNLGEGSGVLVMERGRSGRAPALAEFRGYGTCADAHHLTRPHPGGRGLERAVRDSLAMAGLSPSDICLINAHGTSTVENDRVEGSVITRIFPGSAHVVSTKSVTGHTLGAAGGIEAVHTVLSLARGMAPATAGFEEPDPECGIVPATRNAAVSGGFAMSTSLAFGGNNSALVFGRADS